ncbi:MAG: thermonuclease family protein [Gammaproteobacteria bacterium]|nr:thermonuclease family protein [Gammaproteobacteria bacterium]
MSAHGLSTLRGVVTQVESGDGIAVASSGAVHRVRLAEIDAPEVGQPHAIESRETLIELVLDKDVEVIVIGEDGDGWLPGRVFAGMTDVNAELVRRGLAWLDPQTVRDPVLIELEKIARREMRGLWQDPYPIPPWEWRKGKRQAHQRNRATPVTREHLEAG